MNKHIKIVLAGSIFFLLSVRIVFAQVNDAGLWTYMSIEKKVTARLSFDITEELRMNENITELGTFFTEAGGSYKVTDYFKVGAYYRFINKRQVDDHYSTRHQYHIDLTFKKKFKPITLSFRTKFRGEYRDINSSDIGKLPYYYSENKLTVKYEINRKFEPYFFVEIFNPISRPLKDSHPSGVFMDQAKYCLGVDYTINRRHGLDFYYLLEQEYNVKDPLTEYVVGLGYTYSF